jgi:hypothetical protein
VLLCVLGLQAENARQSVGCVEGRGCVDVCVGGGRGSPDGTAEALIECRAGKVGCGVAVVKLHIPPLQEVSCATRIGQK